MCRSELAQTSDDVTIERHVGARLDLQEQGGRASGIDLIGVEFSHSDRNIIGSAVQTVYPAAMV